MVASNTAGTTKAAGLPNITGQVQGGYQNGPASGAFHKITTANNQDGGSALQGVFAFDASRSSSIYGASSTVQPPAVTVRFIIKY